jgi:hypothetical protein
MREFALKMPDTNTLEKRPNWMTRIKQLTFISRGRNYRLAFREFVRRVRHGGGAVLPPQRAFVRHTSDTSAYRLVNRRRS